MIGVDEAGKGPVLGPMVTAAVRADPTALPDGVDDSKRLSPARRERLAAELRADPDVAVGVAVVTTDRIDDPSTDMNTLTVDGQAAAVAEVARDGDRVVADASDVSESRFADRLGDRLAASGAAVEVTAEHRADEHHALVGAASVVAKVERDARIDALAEEYGDVGSGYPSDRTTRTFLREYVREHGALPPCARESWQTCADLLAAAAQSDLSEF
ncbi:MAG: ribonuclease HII [Haloferacaceae archaeon]